MTFITDLVNQGYKSLIVPKCSQKKFYATKVAVKDLKDDSDIDEFTCESEYEIKTIKVFPRNTWVNLELK